MPSSHSQSLRRDLVQRRRRAAPAWSIDDASTFAALKEFKLLQLLSADKKALMTARRLGLLLGQSQPQSQQQPPAVPAGRDAAALPAGAADAAVPAPLRRARRRAARSARRAASRASRPLGTRRSRGSWTGLCACLGQDRRRADKRRDGAGGPRRGRRGPSMAARAARSCSR